MYVFDLEDELHQYIVNMLLQVKQWSKGIQHTVVTAISLLIMALLSPSCPFHRDSVCVSVHVYVCGGYYVSLACSLLDNLITTFSNTLTYRSKTAIWNVAHF